MFALCGQIDFSFPKLDYILIIFFLSFLIVLYSVDNDLLTQSSLSTKLFISPNIIPVLIWNRFPAYMRLNRATASLLLPVQIALHLLFGLPQQSSHFPEQHANQFPSCFLAVNFVSPKSQSPPIAVIIQ